MGVLSGIQLFNLPQIHQRFLHFRDSFLYRLFRILHHSQTKPAVTKGIQHQDIAGFPIALFGAPYHAENALRFLLEVTGITVILAQKAVGPRPLFFLGNHRSILHQIRFRRFQQFLQIVAGSGQNVSKGLFFLPTDPLV